MSFTKKANQDKLCINNASRSSGGMNVPDMKQLLSQFGLSTAGNRQALKTRLCDYLRAHPVGAAPAPIPVAVPDAAPAARPRQTPIQKKMADADKLHFKTINDNHHNHLTRIGHLPRGTKYIDIEPWYIALHAKRAPLIHGPPSVRHEHTLRGDRMILDDVGLRSPITNVDIRKNYGKIGLDNVKEVCRRKATRELPDDPVKFDPADFLVLLDGPRTDLTPLNDRHGGLNKTIIMESYPAEFRQYWYGHMWDALQAYFKREHQEHRATHRFEEDEIGWTSNRVIRSTAIKVSHDDIKAYVFPELAPAMIRLHDRNNGLTPTLIKYYFFHALQLFPIEYAGNARYLGIWLADDIFRRIVQEKNRRLEEGAAYRVPVRNQVYWNVARQALTRYIALQRAIAQSGYVGVVEDLSQTVQQWEQKPQQQQQEQEQDYAQTAQQFEVTAAATQGKIDSYGNSGTELDSCTYMPTTAPDHEFGFMLDTIYEMEKTCRDMILQEGACSRDGKRIPGAILALPGDIKHNARLKLKIKWETEAGDLMNPKYYAKLLADRAMRTERLSFTLDSRVHVGIDVGGVSRAVFTKAGDYIKSILQKDTAGRYYLKSKMPKDSHKIIAGCISSSIRQGHVLGVPLSYGLLYCIQRGAVPLPNDVPLPTLMALYRMDDSEGLRVLIDTIKNQEGLEMVAPYHARTDTVLPESADLTEINRFEWLRRIIYDKLFRYKGHLDKLMHPDNWHLDNPEVVRSARLEDLSIVLGTALTAEVMANIKFVSHDPKGEEYVRKFLKENPKYWEAFLKFATGSINPGKKIYIGMKMSRGLPVSHTCSANIEIYHYPDYPSFERDMIISLENSEGFGSA